MTVVYFGDIYRDNIKISWQQTVMREMRENRIGWSGKHCMSYINEFGRDSFDVEKRRVGEVTVPTLIHVYSRLHLDDECTKSKLHLAQRSVSRLKLL